MDNISVGQFRACSSTMLGAIGDLILIVGRVPDEEVGGDVWWNYLHEGTTFRAPEGLLLDHSHPQ